jgi:hypothetical protein
MDEDFPSHLVPLATPDGALALGYLIGSWIAFQSSHNLTDPKLQCCEKTRNLFDALAALERLMIAKDEK